MKADKDLKTTLLAQDKKAVQEYGYALGEKWRKSLISFIKRIFKKGE